MLLDKVAAALGFWGTGEGFGNVTLEFKVWSLCFCYGDGRKSLGFCWASSLLANF